MLPDPQFAGVTPGGAVLGSWTFEFLPTVGLLVTAFLYARGWWALRCQVPGRFPPWRLVSFFSGLAGIALALASPLDAFAPFLLMAHMVQHLLLTMVAPPLLLLGAPQLPFLRGLPRRFVREGLGPFLNWSPLKTFVHRLTHPVLAWVLFVASNVVWHFPDFYDLALRVPGWHQFEHLCFLGTSLLFWWHVVQPWPSRPRWPRWAIVPYLLFADLQNTALAAFLSFYDRVLYSTYEKAPRLTDLTALQDQAGAGAIMWVAGSFAFLLPAAGIAIQLLSSKCRRLPPPAGSREIRRSKASGALDLFMVPFLGRLLRARVFRRSMQGVVLGAALLLIADGLLGPRISPINLSGVLPWVHWRVLSVVALLAVGNLFCMACPFTLVRDLGRKILPATFRWPRALRSKWLAVGLLILYLWAYEAFDLWDDPAVTACIILGYFAAALLIDGFFRNASFCKYVCPIGQFNFVQSLISPFEIKVRRPDVCASCRTLDCIKGNAGQRGCELELFQPRKQGNMDCTFCLDCVKACPHDNIGFLAVVPGRDLAADPPRSSVGRFSRRPDLAALVLLLTFGAFANAAGMAQPVLRWLQRTAPEGDFLLITVLLLTALVLLPAGISLAAALASSRLGGGGLWENLSRFSVALAPLGFGMWLAHFVFHFFVAALTPLPIFHRIAWTVGLVSSDPVWTVPSLAFSQLPGLEVLFLDAGLLLTLWIFWKIARQVAPVRSFRAFLPWAVLASLLYAVGVWIVFLPMEMRGTLMQ